MNLTSRTKSSLLGLLGIFAPAILIHYTTNSIYADSAIIAGVAFAALIGYYEGGKAAEHILLESQSEGIHCDSCDGVKYHFYDCPEAQE